MPMTLADRAQGERAWKPWKFTSIGALTKALEEYTALSAMAYLHGAGRDEGDPDPEEMDTYYRIMNQNKEIDRRMLFLGRQAPLYHRLLDCFYCAGLCTEHRGWEQAAKRLGMPIGSRHRREFFEELVSEGVRELFHATKSRSERGIDNSERT